MQNRYGWTRTLASLAALAAAWLLPVHSAQSQSPSPPNFVVFLVDDLRWDDFAAAGQFPFVETPNIDRVAREGTRFLNAFVALPLCSPSRASFLTGLYPHNHGIIDNTERSPASFALKTFPQQLQRVGYETAFLGKWHMGEDDTPRPGFDYWLALRGQGSALRPGLNENGTRQKILGYTTDILTDRAVRFLERPRTKPFLLYLAHKQIHPNVGPSAIGGPGYIPAERHRGKYADTPIPRRLNAGVPPRDKPALQRQIDKLPALGPETETSDDDIRLRLESELAIDESLGKIFDTLKRIGKLDNTVIVVAGDNGYFYGEHGLNEERRLAYEESARIPLLIRYPSMVKAGTTPNELVLNVDLAPTLLEFAGVQSDQKVDGRSLVPLLKAARTAWRKSILIEYFSDRVFPRTRNMGYRAVRTDRFKYIHYTDLQEGMDELYDLESDPYEMNNVIASSAYEGTLREMKAELARLRADTGDSEEKQGRR